MKQIKVNIDWLWFCGISLENPSENQVIIVSKWGRIIQGFGKYKWCKQRNIKTIEVFIKD